MHRFFSNLFRRHKMSFGLNILGLALAFTTFYLLMTQVLFEWGFDSFHKDAERIYRIEYLQPDGEYSQQFSFPDLYLLINDSTQIESGGIKTQTRNGSIALPGDTAGTKNVGAQFCYVTKGYTDVFTFDMIEGSTDSIRNPECALIPLSLAEKLYGKQASYLGETFGDNVSWFLRVGGVYRDFPKNSMLRNMVYQIPNEGWFNQYMSDWRNVNYSGYIKLQKGVNPIGFHPKINYPEGEVRKEASTFRLTPLKDIYYSSNSRDVAVTGNRNINRLLFSIALLIIIIAGVNFMNFSMALVPAKIKSINTQLVLGAQAARLRFSLLLEAMMAAIMAYVLSLLIIFLVSHTSIASFIDADIALQQQWGLVIGTCLVALITGFLSGIYPAYYITSFPPARVINGSFSLSPKGRLLRDVLIGVQFTVSLIVIMVVLFMNLQNQYTRKQSPGFDKDKLIYVGLNQKLRVDLQDVLINKLKQNPNIEGIAFTEHEIGYSDTYMGWGRNTAKGDPIQFDVIPVTADYLRVLGIKVTEGRDFRAEDERNTYGAFIFNQAAKKKYTLEVGDVIPEQGTIVGFMPDIHYKSFRNEVTPMAFYVWGTENWGMRTYGMTLRTKPDVNMRTVMDSVRNICITLEPEFANHGNVMFHNQLLKQLYKREQQQYTLVSIFSLLIIFISIVGVFGLVIFETQTRRKEVGICKVFGSNEFEVLYLFNKTYLKIVLICAMIAIPIAYRIADIWLQNFAFHISLSGWVALEALLIILAIVSATVSIQSWRAANANPIDSLKNQ